MINLGHLSTHTPDMVIELRKRIRWLATNFGFDEIQSTRLEAIVSEIGRIGSLNGQGLEVDICLLPDARNSLLLNFTGPNNIARVNGLSLFFDKINTEEQEGGITQLSALKHLPLSTQPNHALIAQQKELLGRMSRDELITILTKKNRDLEKQSLELNKLNRAITHSPVSIVITDSSGNIEYVNPRFTESTGFTPDEVMGRNPRFLKSGAHGTEFYKDLWQTIISGQSWHGEICNHQKSGKEFWESTNISPIYNTTGEITHFVAIKEDITERRRLTEELKEQVAEMHRSRKAMLNILEDLDEAKRKADSATRAKSAFLANMSHEIRTPLNAIIGMSHLALQTPLNKKQRNYVEKTHHAGENLLSIVNDILDFSKIEAGKMSLESTEFSLDSVMDNLATLLGIKSEDKGLEFLFRIPADLPPALIGDPLRLGQILINLGNNAVKFTESGEIIVGLETISRDAQHIELHFWVKDSGIGLTAEQKQSLFNSFSQADSSITRKYGGTGLGLAISKSLVEQMHGRMWVESEYEKGATFHFTARFGIQPHAAPNPPPSLEGCTSFRALVVDDNASAREILSTLLHGLGLKPDSASDGRQAIQKIEDADRSGARYDLLFLDWKMPEMDGLETLQRLDKLHLEQRPATIMITSSSREDVFSSASQRGVCIKSVITKPATPSSLIEAIGIALNKGPDSSSPTCGQSEVSNTASTLLSGKRVLLVEDNQMNQELAQELLQAEGMAVVIANNGQEALNILECNSKFDVILMDCQMPVMDGYTATREIRKRPSLSAIPVIAMSANAMANDRQDAFSAGMVDHIAKPLNIREMFETLNRWTNPRRTESTSSANQEQITSLPFSAPGIDTRLGLATTSGKTELYIRLLSRFRDSQRDFAGLFSAARQSTDPSAATRAAHTLKGTAGTIGAKKVEAAAAELEKACRDGLNGHDLDVLLSKTQQQLDFVIRGLDSLDGHIKPPAEEGVRADAHDAEMIQKRTDQLVELLNDSDSESCNFFELHEALFKVAFPSHFKIIKDSISSFDFESALTEIQNIRDAVSRR
ncbi:response regulator [Niveibacterium terrae]|uniref:hybrid sensor histidine kinase/response regulator n=1 Tax=Niveibacterium terrae TaxID=3373598 RepID=UPI003A8DFD12